MFFDRMLHYEELGITRVFHAGNGQEALEIIKKEWPELMLLDIRMPVMDGLSPVSYTHLIKQLDSWQAGRQLFQNNCNSSVMIKESKR